MSTSGPKRPKPLSELELRKLIADAIDNGAYVESFHARFGHVERKISVDDVLHGLEHTWSLIGSPQFDEEHWQWKYKIRTTDIEGAELIIVVAVDTRDRSFEVVTRYGVDV